MKTPLSHSSAGRECPPLPVLLEHADSDPTTWSSEFMDHLNKCDVCLHELEVADRRLRRDICEGIIPPPRPDTTGNGKSSRWPEALWFFLLSVAGAAANWIVSQLGRSSGLSGVDWLEVTQNRLLWVGLAGSIVVMLAGFLLHRLNLVRSLLGFVPAALCCFVVMTGGMYLWTNYQREQLSESLDELFLNHHWVSFHSPTFSPHSPPGTEAEREAREDTILKELIDLRQAGVDVERVKQDGTPVLDGVILFAHHDINVAALADEAGFNAIIMHIYVDHKNATKPDLRSAIEMSSVDAVKGYCLGHDPGVTRVKDLARWMEELRKATGKPVTTTFPLSFYAGERGREFVEIGDWLFPDVHAHWHIGMTPQQALKETRDAVDRVAALPRNKPALLKMISYPSGGAEGLTEETQRRFYEGLGNIKLPPGIYASVFNAYDLPWKNRDEGFLLPEYYVGLFTEKGKPKPALEVVTRHTLVQQRP